MTPEKWNQHLELPASEFMESSKIDYRIDDAMERVPNGVSSVLCVGVGDGYELEALSKKGIERVAGIDVSEKAVAFCQEKGLECAHGDMHDIPFPDKSFDLVISRHSLEHAIATWIAFSELCRVAKTYVMIVLPDHDIWESSEWHFLIPTDKQIASMAKKKGMRVINQWHNDLTGEGKAWAVEDGYLLKKV